MSQREDIRALNRALEQFANAPEDFPDEELTGITALNSKVPAPVRGVAAILTTLPPGARLFGLVSILVFVAFAIWRGITSWG